MAAVRKKKVTKKRAPARKKVKTARKAAAGKTPTDYNRAALWKAYKELQNRADLAWSKFRTDVKRKAKPDIIIRDHNHLLLLLGECDYMARECMRQMGRSKKR